MIEMSNTNMIMQGAMTAYKRSDKTELRQVYGRYSEKKAKAFQYCKRLAYGYGGDDGLASLRIISHNCDIFCCGFLFTDSDTGVVRFCYITPTYNRVCDYL